MPAIVQVLGGGLLLIQAMSQLIFNIRYSIPVT
jgi:hypothetical protein